MKADEIIESLWDMKSKLEKCERFLDDIWRCGNSYNCNKEELIKFFAETDKMGNHINWIKLREIIRPDFDDSE